MRNEFTEKVGLDHSGEKKVLAYTFTYGRDSNGIPVSYSGDSIVVEVSENGVTAFSKLWRKIVGEAGTKRQVKSSNDVLDQSWDDVKRMIKNEGATVQIDSVDMVYYSAPYNESQSIMEPAWRLTFSNGGFMYLNAFTGDLVDKDS